MEEKKYIKEQRKYYAGIMFKVTIACVINIVMQYVSYFVALVIGGRETIESSWFEEISSWLTTYAVLPFVIYVLLQKNIAEFKNVYLTRRKIVFGELFGLVCVIYFFLKVGAYLGVLVELLIALTVGADPSGFTAAREYITPEENTCEIMLSFMGTAIFAPIFEELIWRKFIAGSSTRYGIGPAIMLSGVFFGIWHGNFSQCFYAALCGIVFAIVYLYSGNIKYSIILHMSVNMLSSVWQVIELALHKLMQINEFTVLNTDLFRLQFGMMFKNYPLLTIVYFLGEIIDSAENILPICGFFYLIFFIIRYIGIRKEMMIGSVRIHFRAIFNWGSFAFVLLSVMEIVSAYLSLIL